MQDTTTDVRSPPTFGADRRPCGSCPYRTDTPCGIWDSEEYNKLPQWDKPMDEQPHGVFLCHHTQDAQASDVTLCRGWLDVHGSDALGVRVAIITGRLDAALLDEEPLVELYPNGTAAAQAGLAAVANPQAAAVDTMRRLLRQNPRLTG